MNVSSPTTFGFSVAESDLITWATTYIDIAALALVSYDAILTLDVESRVVWRGRWGIPTILYLLNRYGVIIQAGFVVIPVADSTLSLPACYFWLMFGNWSKAVIMLLVEAMLAMRVSALYGGFRAIVCTLWLWYCGAVVAMFIVAHLAVYGAYAVPSPAPPTLGCRMAGQFTDYWALWVPSLVFEATVALLTLGKAVHHKRMLRSTPLLFVLIRDGFLAFFGELFWLVRNLSNGD